MPPPPNVPTHHINTVTPNAKGKAPMAPGVPPTGLQTPLHTPAGRPAQGNGGDRMAQNLVNRHAARLKQIQEAQDAQRKEEENAARARASPAQDVGEGPAERRVSFAPVAGAAQTTSVSDAGAGPSAGPSAAASARPSPPQVLLRSSDTIPDTESDEYHFPSEDDAFLANLDLDALDEGIGRPIDFEDGVHPDVDMDAESSTNAASVGAYNQSGVPQQQQRPPPPQRQMNTASVLGSSSGAQSRGGQAEQRPPTRFGQAAGQGVRARTPSMGGGFNFASEQVCVALNAFYQSSVPDILILCLPKPGANSANASRASSVSNQNQQPQVHQGGASSLNVTAGSLKRSADIMQCVFSPPRSRGAAF